MKTMAVNRLASCILKSMALAGDNTAKAVHACCEHLCIKKLCPLIILCRLPVGRTHEDIDSR